MTYEDFLKLAQARRSVRRFSAQLVRRHDVVRCLEAARWAPSNHNRQPWRFLVLEAREPIARLAAQVDAEIKEKLKALPAVAAGHVDEFAHYATFFASAPVVILVMHRQPVRFAQGLLTGLAHPELVSGEPLSAAMAVQNLALAAQTLGLGTCALTGPLLVPEAIRSAVTLPPGHEVTCLVALGYPAEEPAPPRRKSVEQIAEFRNADPGQDSP